MFFLSWRQLISRKKQTLLILLGISFGTLLYVSITGLQLGMREYIFEQLLSNTAHILISGSEKDILPESITEVLYGDNKNVFWRVAPAGKRDETKIKNVQGWYQFLDKETEVLDYSPRLSTNVLLGSGQFSAPVNLIGTLPEKHARVSHIEKYIKQGSFLNLKSGGNSLVIGSGVAKKLGVHLNQIVNVSSRAGLSRPYKIVGILHFGNEQIDQSIAYAHLKNVQTVTQRPGRVSEIAVALWDVEKSNITASFWKNISTDKVQDWKEANKAFMEVIGVQDFSRYFITWSVLLVAAFGIYNVLTIMINQKKREIAILRAIGYSPARIFQLIFYQGIVLGMVGGLLGLFLGWLMCLWIGSINFGFEIGGSNNLLISYDWQIYFSAFITANISALIASFIPAWEAKNLTPMDIIRSET